MARRPWLSAAWAGGCARFPGHFAGRSREIRAPNCSTGKKLWSAGARHPHIERTGAALRRGRTRTRQGNCLSFEDSGRRPRRLQIKSNRKTEFRPIKNSCRAYGSGRAGEANTSSTALEGPCGIAGRAGFYPSTPCRIFDTGTVGRVRHVSLRRRRDVACA